MLTALFGFSGRIGRGGWWFAQLVGILIIGLLFAGALALHDPQKAVQNKDPAFLILLLIALLLISTVNICSTVKRYHDRGKSGFWYFISFVPFIGGIWQLIECGFCSGEEGDNQYGPPPGAGRRMESLNREVSGMAASSGALSKLDDDYIANYAKKIAMQQATSQMAAASGFGQNPGAKPTFGKR
jgi:uncharacterized membrane protein YhaH (DUF805 family)